jgi:mRNA-degrading endonuclease toxin of MazEF toxin-antitoxin module
MPSFSKSEVILVRYPFSDLTAIKVRPAVIVGASDRSSDYLVVPLTSRTGRLAAGEFALTDWKGAGLNVPSTVKWGVYTIHVSLILKSVGSLSAADARQVEQSLRLWFEIS